MRLDWSSFNQVKLGQYYSENALEKVIQGGEDMIKVRRGHSVTQVTLILDFRNAKLERHFYGL